jgi:hypothetical protein
VLRTYEKILETGSPISKVSFNNYKSFNGLIHLVDYNNDIVFAKKLNKGNDLIRNYYKKEFKELDPFKSREQDNCVSVTTFHYEDRYNKDQDTGELIYTHTNYLGKTVETICAIEYLPEYEFGGEGGSGSGNGSDGGGTYQSNCSSNYGSKTRYLSKENEDCAVKVTEEIIECEKGYEPDENGNCVEIVPQINNNLTNDCAKNIFTELENGLYKEDPLKPEVTITNRDNLNFSEEILAMFNDSDKIHYTIQNGTNDSNASTKGATTTISDAYLQNATKLSIARTMIHEQIHAYINAKYSNFIHFNSLSFRNKLDKYAEDKGYTIGTNEFHHNFMGKYVDAMAYSLYEWDKKNGTGKANYNNPSPDDLLGWDYYKAMAYGGLFTVDPNTGNINSETDSFKELVPNASDRQKIADIVVNENNGNQDAESEKCN